MKRSMTMALAVAVLALAVAACGDDDDAAPTGSTIAATATNFAFSPDLWTVSSGAEVTLTLTNVDSAGTGAVVEVALQGVTLVSHRVTVAVKNAIHVVPAALALRLLDRKSHHIHRIGAAPDNNDIG